MSISHGADDATDGPMPAAGTEMDEKKNRERTMAIGCELRPDGAGFRVWAPNCRRVEVVIEPDRRTVVPLEPEADGYFAGVLASGRAGTRYRFRLDGGEEVYPDPASRFQPGGPHGPSEVIDPSAFEWSDASWNGCGLAGQVIYEMHVGTFTREGTWNAAAVELPELARLGVTSIELMPVSDFPGRFGWGYDGVDFFAPTRLYGRPDDFRRFVDRAHALGLGVVLDVVYNHFGPDGNYLSHFSADYFSRTKATEWGKAINFDGKNSGPVRQFVLENAAYWIREYHLDGLRLDATQSIFDQSERHILTDVGVAARRGAGNRRVLLLAENEPQHAELVRPIERGGHGLDALWNDDYHHSAMVALTGKADAYYSDYMGRPQELISAVKWGYLFQGQRYAWQKEPRGHPALDVEPASFVFYLQNHDQVANSARGRRIHLLTSAGRYRALTALLLLGPATPMLFQGQEFAASAPFLFFADHVPELAPLVRAGRGEFMKQFPPLASDAAQKRLADPGLVSTFDACKLDFGERASHAEAYALHRDLLALRRADPVFCAQRKGRVDGAVLSDDVFLLRFFGTDGDDRLLLVNLGRDLRRPSISEPLYAPPREKTWRELWSSEDARYGGEGTYAVETEHGFRLPAECAIVFFPRPAPVLP